MLSARRGRIGRSGVAARSGSKLPPLRIQNCRFDSVNFRGATFSGDTSFHKATFTGDTSFHKMVFTGDAEFSEATFSDHATFREATFKRDAFFNEAISTGATSFFRATFNGIWRDSP